MRDGLPQLLVLLPEDIDLLVSVQDLVIDHRNIAHMLGPQRLQLFLALVQLLGPSLAILLESEVFLLHLLLQQSEFAHQLLVELLYLLLLLLVERGLGLVLAQSSVVGLLDAHEVAPHGLVVGL